MARMFTGILSAAAILLALGPAIAQSGREQPGEARDIDAIRAQWFYGQRAYPHKSVPSGALYRAGLERDRHEAADFAHAPVAATASWKSLGPKPVDTPYTDPVVAGRVSALAVDPTNSQTVYLGAAQGGVWKTTDGGTTWAALTDGESSLAVGAIAVDPGNHLTVYAGTGEENFSGDSYYGQGLLKSTDGGTSWTHICASFCGPIAADGYYGGGARIGSIAVDPSSSSILLAGVAMPGADGIYRSSNGGKTWSSVLSGNPGTGVTFDPTNGNIAYAAISNNFSGGTTGVYRSTDAGAHWTAINGAKGAALTLGNAGRIVLAIAPSSPTTLYASIANRTNGSLLGLFRSTDSGQHWSHLTVTDFCTPQCSYDNVVAVDPADSNVVYAGGAFSTTLVQSLDGGTTWSVVQSAQSGGFLHGDMHALAYSADGAQLYLGNDGGAYKSSNFTQASPAFTGLNPTLAITQFYGGLSIHPNNPKIAIGGTQDNGTELYSGSATWNDVVCGDGGRTAIDPANGNTMYAACNQISIHKSTQGGAFGTWTSAQSGIDTSDRVEFIPPLAIVPLSAKARALYFGTYRVYQSTNGARSWKAISPDLTNGPAFWGVVTAIAGSANTVYAATGDGNVQVSTNANLGTAATWTKVDSGLPPRVATTLAVNEATASTAYVGFSGFSGFGDSLGHVFMTTNGGGSWSDISGNLPNAPVNAVTINANKPNQIFVGTDVGVFYTDDGVTWNVLGKKLPHVAVLGLTFQPRTGTLMAATHGRGVWDLNVSTLP